MITRPHTPDEIPDDIMELIEQAKAWKQRLTTEFGPSRNMKPEISLFGESLDFYGDVEFSLQTDQYDWMGVGLSLSGLVMAFDVRYMMFSTEALMVAAHDYNERGDGTLRSPSLDELQKFRYTSHGDIHQAWLNGDKGITQTVLVCITDTLMGRTWNATLPFDYELGNKVNWLSLIPDADQGPDYRSSIWGAMLLPAVIRSQYDYMTIRPDPSEAMEYLFAQGLTMSITDQTPMSRLMEEHGLHMIPLEELDSIRREQEEFISRELSAIPDALPEDWAEEDD